MHDLVDSTIYHMTCHHYIEGTIRAIYNKYTNYPIRSYTIENLHRDLRRKGERVPIFLKDWPIFANFCKILADLKWKEEFYVIFMRA